MLPDLSPSHILIVLVAALIFIGPKDLPAFLRKIGQFVGKMRNMANEFRASFDEMARQSELDDLRKEVEAMRQASQAALPKDLGIAAQMQSDAEAAYLANWEASHAAPTDGLAAEPVILPPPETPAAPATAAKPKAAPKKAAPKAAKTEAVAEAAPKPRAQKTSAQKTSAQKTSAQKPSARKPKPGADA